MLSRSCCYGVRSGHSCELIKANTIRLMCYTSQRVFGSNSLPESSGIFEKVKSFGKRRAAGARSVYRRVIDGSKWCVSDIKTYYILKRDLARGVRTVAQLQQNELEILIQTNEELFKLVIVLILIPLPLTVYLFAVAITFCPRLILTRHFWTNEQRRSFWTDTLNNSVNSHLRPIGEELKRMKVNLPSSIDGLKEVETPQIETLSLIHLYHLARLHHLAPFAGTKGLYSRAQILRQLDYFLSRSGAVDEMNDQQLYLHLYLRRLQSCNMSTEEMRNLLKKWIQYSCSPDLRTSAYLHAPAIIQLIGRKELT